MSAKTELTTGAIATLLEGGSVEGAVLQILGHKRVAGESERYRLLLSDGRHITTLALLSSQLAHLVHEEQLTTNSVVRLQQYVVNAVQNGAKKVVIVLDLSVLVPGAQMEKIGDPQSYSGSSAGAPTTNGTHSNGQKAPVQAAAAVGAVKPITPAKTAPVTTKTFAPVNAQNIIPIGHLTPYSNKWTVRFRVTNKSDVRTWSNARGEGKLFSFEMLDESGEIRCTAFKDQCDKFYDFIQVGKTYYMSRATLKPANKQFCGSIQHDFELTLNGDSQIEHCDESTNIPDTQFNFVSIEELQNVDRTALIDVIGVCKHAGEVERIQSRKLNKELLKRDVKLVDQSNTEVTLTLWGSTAENFQGVNNPVVALKGVKVSDYNGCSLGAVSSTRVHINPELDLTFKLKGWFENEGMNLEATSISNKRSDNNNNFKTFGEARLENVGANGSAAYFSACATILQLRSESCLYQSCPNGDCKKKVVDLNNGLFRCEKCNQEFSEFRWRLLVQMNVADATGNMWVSAFQETAETMLGVSADQLGKMRDADPNGFSRVFVNASFSRFNLVLRAKMETYNDESRLKVVVSSCTPVNADLKAYKKRLCEEITALGVTPTDVSNIIS